MKDIRVSGSFDEIEIRIQILSDVLNQPITLPDNSEGAVLPAPPYWAFISSGKMKSIADTAHLVHPRRIYTPQEENREVYDELYDIFVRLYHNLQTEFSDITEYQKKI